MLREDLPKNITASLPGPKATSVIARRTKAVPNAIVEQQGCLHLSIGWRP